MRTTIEISDEQRAKLLHLAAQRGEKGFSGLVQEAIDRFLAEEAARTRKARLEAALAVAGTLKAADADVLEARVRSLRDSWR